MAIDSKVKNALALLLEVLGNQGLKLLIPYVHILGNPFVRMVINRVLNKIIDHLTKVDDAKSALDVAKYAKKMETETLGQRKVEAREALREIIRHHRGPV